MKFAKKLNKLKDQVVEAHYLYFVKYKKSYMLSIHTTTDNFNEARKFYSREAAQEFIDEIKHYLILWNFDKKSARYLKICSIKTHK